MKPPLEIRWDHLFRQHILTGHLMAPGSGLGGGNSTGSKPRKPPSSNGGKGAGVGVWRGTRAAAVGRVRGRGCLGATGPLLCTGWGGPDRHLLTFLLWSHPHRPEFALLGHSFFANSDLLLSLQSLSWCGRGLHPHGQRMASSTSQKSCL